MDNFFLLLYVFFLLLYVLNMSSYGSSSSSSGDCPHRFAGNTQLREHGCYVDISGANYEVPCLDCEQNLRWALFSQSVDVIYPSGSSSSSSGDCPHRFAGNTRLHELGCYVDLSGAYYEVPCQDVKFRLRCQRT